MLHWDHERAAPILPAQLLEFPHAALEALPLLDVGARTARDRHEMLVPGAVAIEPFLRRLAEGAFLVTRCFGLRVAEQDAEFREQEPQGPRFARRQRDVVRAPRVARHCALAPTRVAAGCALQLEDLEVAEP